MGQGACCGVEVWGVPVMEGVGVGGEGRRRARRSGRVVGGVQGGGGIGEVG
jgi:hypothetical protein